MKIYKTPLCRMKIETFERRIASHQLRYRLRQWYNSQLSATRGQDGYVHFTRI